jgi:dipeptidyl-peptidase-4
MKTPVRCFLFLVLTTMLSVSSGVSQVKKPLTFEQIYRNAEPRLLKQLPTVTGWPDDSHYLVAQGRGGSIMKVDAATGQETPFNDMAEFKSLGDSLGIAFAMPASKSDDNTMFAYLKNGDVYVLNTKTKSVARITSTEAQEKNPTVSPDGSRIAYTRSGNLFITDLATLKETSITNDGGDAVYNGYAAWLYYEEIFGRASQYRAFWWSPDSKRVAFYRFDETKVPMFPLYSADGQHGYTEQTRYPEAGDPNPDVKVGLVSATGGPVVWADFDYKADQYFGTPFWTPDSKQLLVQWMNRGQDNLKIYSVDPASGKKKEFYDEHQDSWVEWFTNLTFLKNGSGVIIKTDKDGWMHLYLYGMDGKLKNRITSGEWTVDEIQAVDEANGELYFTAKKENSARTDLYKIRVDGKNLTRLTFGEFSHSVKVSPTGKYFTTSYSNVATPTRAALYTGDGKLVHEIGDSKLPAFDEYDLAKTELIRVPTPDGYQLPVTWTLPAGFDPAKQYPVLISIYGGPNAGMVFDRWGGISNQWLAKEGVIQVGIDHRGSGHFGKKGVALMHRNLGKWEMNDYIEVVKWLRAQGFVDSSRVCITGGSYGGYVTCMALTAGAGYFTHGVAEFSVTDWKLYDSHYTERYMDSPAENPEGYKAGAVLTYADKYKGDLFIIHGTLDDNVHPQNSIQFIDKLEDLNKHFELLLYPNQRHGWGGPKGMHLRSEVMRYYYKNLIRKPFPEELFSQPMMGGRPF